MAGELGRWPCDQGGTVKGENCYEGKWSWFGDLRRRETKPAQESVACCIQRTWDRWARQSLRHMGVGGGRGECVREGRVRSMTLWWWCLRWVQEFNEKAARDVAGAKCITEPTEGDRVRDEGRGPCVQCDTVSMGLFRTLKFQFPL